MVVQRQEQQQGEGVGIIPPLSDRRTKLNEFRQAFRTKDPYQIQKAFRLPYNAFRSSSSSSNGSGAGSGREQQQQQQQYVNGQDMTDDDVDWSNVLTAWFSAYDALAQGHASKAYEYQSSLHTYFNQAFASSPGNFLVPALHAVCQNTHKLALLADYECQSHEHAKLQNAVTLLQESFSRTYNDRKELRSDEPYNAEDGSKKAGVLFVVNELFAIYFRLNTLRLCKNLLRPVETRKLHEQGTTMGQMVTYRYYVGRLNLFEDQYAAAEEHLQYALNHCYRTAIANKKRILHYLVPVELYRGRLPSAALLEKYELHEYICIVDAIRTGNLRKFNDALFEYQHIFIRQGTYLLLEKCKTVCYRNLFKRIHLVLEKHQIPLGQVASVFKWLGMPIDLDEVECILANLIYRGYVRGYLSHTKRVLVLSKRDPFPVSSVIAGS